MARSRSTVENALILALLGFWLAEGDRHHSKPDNQPYCNAAEPPTVGVDYFNVVYGNEFRYYVSAADPVITLQFKSFSKF